MHRSRHSTLTLVTLLALLAVTSGAVTDAAFAGKRQVKILRNEYGVPHVFGKSLESTWYGVGYASAQDRLWQAETLRRAATGTLAEYFGASALAGDIQARAVFGSQAYRADQFDRLSPNIKKVITAYVTGFNAWIDEASATGQLPVEYGGLGLPPPRPWTIDDTLAITLVLLNRFGEYGSAETEYHEHLTELVARLGADAGGRVFFDSHWLQDPSAPTTVPPGEAAMAGVATPRSLTLPPAVLELTSTPSFERAAAELRRGMRGWERNAKRAGLWTGPASNAIAIGPELSATGRPLLLAGPQMGYTVPQVNHEMGIHGGGYDVTGMTIAGIPAVFIGVSESHAWTLTASGTDNNDLYLESVSTANPLEYSFLGSSRQFECRPEVFGVAGGDPVTQVLCNSVHGPVLAAQPGLAVTLKRAVRGREWKSIEGLHGVMRAKSLKEVDRALSRIAHTQNVLYADVKGNIAYWHIGKIPIRAAGDSPFLPHIGAGIAEWQGFIPWENMPHARNPAQGWLVSWNNKPTVNWFNSSGGFWQWGPVSRVRTLMNLLKALPPGSATVQTIEQLNLVGGWTTDTPSGNASTVVVSTLLGDLLGKVDVGADARLADVVGLLAGWNLLQLDLDVDGRYDNPAVAIFNTWWQTFINRVFADELGSTLDNDVVANMAGRLLRPGQGLPLLYNYLGGETVEAAVTGSLVDTLDALTSAYGSAEIGDWLQTAAVIDWDPIGAVDVPDTPWMNRGTYNQITRLGRGNKMYAQNVIAPGQSGNPLNRHFADQLINYATWRYKEMYLTRQALKGNIESRTTLQAPRIKVASARRADAMVARRTPTRDANSGAAKVIRPEAQRP